MVDANLPLFIDTNSFLQLKDFNQIAWRELFPQADHITLYVCSAVIGELDKHKTSTNQRRRNRARNALKLVESAAAASDMILLIRAESPRVTLAIWRGRPVWSDFPDLDQGNADDYLVAAAATDERGVVLSHDTGPRIRARISGVQAACPPDSWLLPPEQTDDQRKISQLTRELEAAHNARPQLDIVIPPDDPIKIKVTSVPYLGNRAVDKLVKLILERFPAKQMPATSYPNQRAVFSDAYVVGQTSVDAYHQEYDEFASEVRTYFTTLHERVDSHSLAQQAPCVVINTGSVSAKNLTLSFDADGDVQFFADREEAQVLLGDIALPEPPTPPRNRMFYDAGRLTVPSNKPRDPTHFYWRKRPNAAGYKSASLECADFRPGCERAAGILIYATGDLPSPGKLIVSASAEHHEAIVVERKLICENVHADWLAPLVQSFLPQTVRDAFAKVDPGELPTW